MLNEMEQSELKLKVDRTAFAVVPLAEETGDKAYWLPKTPYERLYALELMRQIIYGYNPSTTQLQRVLTIAQFPSS